MNRRIFFQTAALALLLSLIVRAADSPQFRGPGGNGVARGVTTVFRPDPEKFELLATNDLGEPSNATPALSDGQIFLRTEGHLYCIAEN